MGRRGGLVVGVWRIGDGGRSERWKVRVAEEPWCEVASPG